MYSVLVASSVCGIPMLVEGSLFPARLSSSSGTTYAFESASTTVEIPFVVGTIANCSSEAGFTRAEAMASVSSSGSLEETRRSASFQKAQLDGLARTAVAEAWLSDIEAQAIGQAIVAWGEQPGAFSATVWCEALGWVAEET